MRFTHLTTLLGSMSVACSLFGCSGGASVKLQLHNDTGTAAVSSGLQTQGVSLKLGTRDVTGTSAASHLELRPRTIYLVEDVDPTTQDNIGAQTSIWASAHCTGTADQETGVVCDYFDFARDSAVVNADLNSQGASVAAGTYRYVRIDFGKDCDKNGVGNVRWQAPSMDAPREFTFGMCGITSAKMDPPLVVGAGDSVVLSVAYSLDGSIASGTTRPGDPPGNAITAADGHGIGFLDCLADATGLAKTCLNMPTFVPSVVKTSAAATAQ